MKVIVFIIGTTSMGLVYIVEKLGGLAPLTIAFAGVTSGPILGLFFMGMLLPQITSTVYTLVNIIFTNSKIIHL